MENGACRTQENVSKVSCTLPGHVQPQDGSQQGPRGPGHGALRDSWQAGGPVSLREGGVRERFISKRIQPLPPSLCLDISSQNVKLPIFKWGGGLFFYLSFLFPFLHISMCQNHAKRGQKVKTLCGRELIWREEPDSYESYFLRHGDTLFTAGASLFLPFPPHPKLAQQKLLAGWCKSKSSLCSWSSTSMGFKFPLHPRL